MFTKEDVHKDTLYRSPNCPGGHMTWQPASRQAGRHTTGRLALPCMPCLALLLLASLHSGFKGLSQSVPQLSKFISGSESAILSQTDTLLFLNNKQCPNRETLPGKPLDTVSRRRRRALLFLGIRKRDWGCWITPCFSSLTLRHAGPFPPLPSRPHSFSLFYHLQAE